MAYQNRPKRQRKADRLLSPGSTGAEIQCDYGIAPMDQVATEMDLKWGIERLPELVSVETANKYGNAIAHLNACIQEADPAKCAAAAQNCIRGLNAMDAEAERLGCEQATGALFEYQLDMGDAEPFRFGVMADDRQWQAAKARRPDLVLFTMREVANALRQYMTAPLQTELDKHFPAAKNTAIKPKTPVDYANGGDQISF